MGDRHSEILTARGRSGIRRGARIPPVRAESRPSGAAPLSSETLERLSEMVDFRQFLAPLGRELDEMQRMNEFVRRLDPTMANLALPLAHLHGSLTQVLRIVESIADLVSATVIANLRIHAAFVRIRESRNRLVALQNETRVIGSAVLEHAGAMAVEAAVGSVRSVKEQADQVVAEYDRGSPFGVISALTLLGGSIAELLIAIRQLRMFINGLRNAVRGVNIPTRHNPGANAPPPETPVVGRPRSTSSAPARPVEGSAQARGAHLPIARRVDQFLARYGGPKFNKDIPENRASLNDLYDRTLNAEVDTLRRAAAAELQRIVHYLNDPDVLELRLLPGRSTGRTPDLLIKFDPQTGRQWERVEITSLTQADRGRCSTRWAPHRRATLRALIDAVKRKVVPKRGQRHTQLDSPIPGVTPGGQVSVHIMFPPDDIRGLIDQAMRYVNRRLRRWPHLESVEWTITADRTSPSAPLRRIHIVFERQNGRLVRVP